MKPKKRLMYILDFVLMRKGLRIQIQEKDIIIKNLQAEINILRENLCNFISVNNELSRENSELKAKKKPVKRAKK